MTSGLNLNSIWNTVLSLAKDNSDFDDIFYDNFIADTKLVKFEDDFAYVLIEDTIGKLTLENNLKLLEDYLQKSTETNFKIKLFTKEEYDSNNISDQQPAVSNEQSSFASNLIERFTFSTFVVGNSNRESYQASLAVSSDPGNLFNPLFIYGNSGLGKTHLINSIGNEIKKQRPNMRILYVSGENFINDYLELVKGKRENEWFDKKYRDIDVLIVDDIQSLGSRQKTNEMFFNVYNDLFNKNKQIIITSDVMPKELDGLEQRLVSRFSQGLSVSIAPPEFSTSIQILKNKIKNSSTDCEELSISDEALEFIATHFSSDVRDLEGALNRLLFWSINFLNTNTITIDTVHDTFKDFKTTKINGEVSPEKILKTVTSYYNLTKTQITSSSRQKKIAVPRHIAIYLTRNMLDTPYEKIGKLYGNRDHSTIMSSYHKIKQKIDENDKDYIKVIDELKELLIS